MMASMKLKSNGCPTLSTLVTPKPSMTFMKSAKIWSYAAITFLSPSLPPHAPSRGEERE